MFGLDVETSNYMNKIMADLSARMRAYREREFALWAKQDRHGRWVVVEGLELGVPISKRTRRLLHASLARRGRRFASLSRARRFATEVGGHVRHWRAHEWKRANAWSFAIPGLGIKPYCSIEKMGLDKQGDFLVR